MASYDASVRLARSWQRDLKAHGERCAADPEKLAEIGVEIGHQVRIVRGPEQLAMYTVSEGCPERPDRVVRMGAAGRRRLGMNGGFEAVVDSRVPHPTLSAERAEGEGELIERLSDDGRQSGLIAIAPHGGAIEPETDRQAERVRSRLGARVSSAWRCKGWGDGDQDAFERWHITSVDINEASFPRLASVVSRGFTYAVAFHGFDDEEAILIGGAAPDALKLEIRSALEDATAASNIVVRTAVPGDAFGGDHPRNIVNRLGARGAGGIQIEQSLEAREKHWREIANAVAEVYGPKL